MEIKIENLRISQPLPSSKKYHVFNKEDGNRSLCGRYMIFAMKEDLCEMVTGKEKYLEGQDCKSCFNKIPKI